MPDFDWLYGDDRKGRQPEADHTRVLPTLSRSQAPKTPTPPPPGRIAPTPGGRPPRRRGLRPVRLALLLVLLYLVYLVAVPFWAWQRMDHVDAAPAGDRPAEQPGTNYLLIGSDSRKGLSEEDKKALGVGGVGVDGGRTDTIKVLHVGDGPSLVMNLPRDSIVPVPGHGTTKINAAFAFGGPKLLVQTIEQSTGLRIDHVVELGFGGFVKLVDGVGGIEICPKKAMKDPRANLDIKAGCQEADGLTALGYSRSRHSAELGDIGRGEQQNEVLRGVGAKLWPPWVALNPVRYYQLAMVPPTTLRVSEGTGPIDLARFGAGMFVGDSLDCTIPLADLSVRWDRDRALELLSFIKEDRTADIPQGLCTTNGFPQ